MQVIKTKSKDCVFGVFLTTLVYAITPLTAIAQSPVQPATELSIVKQFSSRLPGSAVGLLDVDSPIWTDERASWTVGSRYASYIIEGDAGDTITLDLVSEVFGPNLVVIASNGNVLIEEHSYSGHVQAVVTLPERGRHQVIVSNTLAEETGQYRLSWRPGQSKLSGALTEESSSMNGHYYDVYSVYGTAGEFLTIDLTTTSETLDPHLTLLSPNDDIVAEDSDSGYGDSAQLVAELPETGLYQIVVGTENPTETGSFILSWGTVSALDLVSYLYTQANNLAQLGQYSDIESLYKEALLIRQKWLGTSDRFVAASLSDLGLLYHSLGRYVEAAPLLEEALETSRQALGGRHIQVAGSLGNLALLYYDQGRYEEAASLSEEAVDVGLEYYGRNHTDMLPSLNNLAFIYQAQKRYSEAEALYKEVLATYRDRWNGNHNGFTTALSNLGLLHSERGQYNEAESLFKESLTAGRRRSGDRSLDVANSLHNLGMLYLKQQRYDQAKPFLEEALDINRAQLGDRHPIVANNLTNLAVMYQAKGQLESAIETLEAALDIEESNLDINLAALSDVHRQKYAATLSATTDAALSLPFQTDEPVAKHLALTTLLRRKGRLLEASAGSLRSLRQNLAVEDQATLDNLFYVRQALSALVFSTSERANLEQYQADIIQLEAKAIALETELSRRSAGFRAQVQPTNIDDVKAQLPTDGGLLEYVRYHPLDISESSGSFSDARYAAYILFPDGQIKVIDLGLAEIIDKAAASMSSSLADRNVPTEILQRQARSLYDLVLAPVEAELTGLERLIISPDDALNLVPFEVLRTAEERYLIEDFAISYLNSGRELIRQELTPTSGNAPVIVAAPRYGQVSAENSISIGFEGDLAASTAVRSIDLGSLTVSPLTGATVEGQILSTLMPQSLLLMGSEATETALKQLSSPSILHIATHGLFLPRISEPLELFRQPALEQDITNAGSYQILAENPLLRSMLAMADFNTRGREKDGVDDGVFTALEASALNLSGTQLVTLSACETGQGDVVNGEGVYGLRRSLTIAGTESLLMSLWRVEDDGTARLMENYYTHLLAGMGRSDALRKTQLDMITSSDVEQQHPYRWAAFVLTGDWRAIEGSGAR